MTLDIEYLRAMGWSYLMTIAIETPVLVVGLAKPHRMWVRLVAGVGLTACTYPLLWLVLPRVISLEEQRGLFLAVGETLVPVAECAIFFVVFELGRRYSWRVLARDWGAIVAANLASFGIGEVIHVLWPNL
jgi:hypothetical protein